MKSLHVIGLCLCCCFFIGFQFKDSESQTLPNSNSEFSKISFQLSVDQSSSSPPSSISSSSSPPLPSSSSSSPPRNARQVRQRLNQYVTSELHFGMLSRDEFVSKERGEVVELTCEFNLEYYHAFDNPVIWLKSQLLEAKIKINSMSVIEQPFLAAARFFVSWHKQPPRYWFTLTIKDLKAEDTGNYTCEIRGKKSSIIMDVVKTLIVRDHIRIVQLILRPPHPPTDKHPPTHLITTHSPTNDSPIKSSHRDKNLRRTFDSKERPTVVITSLNQIENQIIEQDQYDKDASIIAYDRVDISKDFLFQPSKDEINFSEESSNTSLTRLRSEKKDRKVKHGNESKTKVVVNSGDVSSFECLIVGGYPQPLLEIFIGDRNITSSFRSNSRIRLVGDKGFKRLDLETSVTSREVIVLTHRDHNQDFVCKARSSHASTPLTARIKLQINHKPVVTCMPTSARIDDVNVCLQCEVIGRPAPAIFWTLDQHPVTMETRNNGYWSLVRDKSDGVFETSLCIGRTIADVFRSYDLVAENSFGRSSGRIDLILNVTRKSKDVLTSAHTETRKQLFQQLSINEHNNASSWFSYKFYESFASQLHAKLFFFCQFLMLGNLDL